MMFVAKWIPSVVAPPLCPEKLENLHKCRAHELCQGTSSIIHQDNLIEIVFVFSADMLEEFWVDFTGMSDVYFTRSVNHFPFSTIIAESHPKSNWYSTIGIQGKVRKMMSCKWQQQLFQKSGTTTLSLECWRYITRQLSHHVAPIPFSKAKLRYRSFQVCQWWVCKSFLFIRLFRSWALLQSRILEKCLAILLIGWCDLPLWKGAPKSTRSW